MKKRRFIKVWEWIYESKLKSTIVTYLRCELFNPFIERPPQEIIPYFEFIPRIGIGINKDLEERGRLKIIKIFMGWLNFYLECCIHIWKPKKF